MLTVNCEICHLAITNRVISKNPAEEVQLVGMEMFNHLRMSHPKLLEEITMRGMQANALLIMTRFSNPDESSVFNTEKEEVRRQVLEACLVGSPEEKIADSYAVQMNMSGEINKVEEILLEVTKKELAAELTSLANKGVLDCDEVADGLIAKFEVDDEDSEEDEEEEIEETEDDEDEDEEDDE